MTKFIHFRNVDDTETGTTATKGGVTVAFSEGEGHLTYAVAHCSPRDNYCRKTGRAIAEGRLKAGKSHKVVFGGNDDSVYETLMELI